MAKQWGSSYVNPNMSPAVIKALADAGFAPDGSKLPPPMIGSAFDGMSTQDRLNGINDRITQDWQRMGFNPPAPPAAEPPPEENIFEGANSPFADTGPDPFGQETRQKLDGLNSQIDSGFDRVNSDMRALEAPPAPEPSQTPQGGLLGGMSYTTPLPAPMPAPPVPKPTPRPRPSSYTVKAGDNPTTIARRFGMTLKELEAKNPGILKKARRMRVGGVVNI